MRLKPDIVATEQALWTIAQTGQAIRRVIVGTVMEREPYDIQVFAGMDTVDTREFVALRVTERTQLQTTHVEQVTRPITLPEPDALPATAPAPRDIAPRAQAPANRLS